MRLFAGIRATCCDGLDVADYYKFVIEGARFDIRKTLKD